ncbi:MAG: TonB-dependent receptor plug domain-containing protein, partial [Terriglobales bacterium]
MLAIAVASSLGVPTAAWAQTAESTLRGRAAPGSEVVATEVDTGAVRRTTTSSDGTYVIAGLQAGNYHVVGSGKSADVTVPVASVQVLDLVAATAAGGAIVVTGTRPTAEVHTSQVNQFVTLHDIAVLPQVTRNFLEFADTVPGMQFEVNGASHNTSLRGGAQLASSVNVYIDGISQKDYIGGGSGITGSAGPQANGDPGNPFPQLAIAEYKVVTSNYSAEYGDAASSIIIAQTKSGTNQFHGEAFGTFTNQDLRARYPAETATHTKKGKEPSKEYGVAFSGPIVKDVAHFFFTWEHKGLSNASDVFPGSGISPEQA